MISIKASNIIKSKKNDDETINELYWLIEKSIEIKEIDCKN